MNKLVIDNLTKVYSNEVKALNSVSLSIENGMFGLLGPNGAGKSSLMRTIATLQEPSSGSIHFNSINTIKTPQFIRSQLGYLPQEFGVYPKMSALDLLSHIAILKGIINKKERETQINELLKRTNLFEHRKKAVYNYSGGMKQRFGIAQALLGNPKLIIVDEPTAGLDPEERNRFLNLLSEIGEDIIVILSTHIVEDVKDLCGDMAILYSGKIVLKGNPKVLVDQLIGKIWVKAIKKKEMEDYEARHSILSKTNTSGEIQLRVFSEEKLNNDFEMTEPDLKDLYFLTIQKNK